MDRRRKLVVNQLEESSYQQLTAWSVGQNFTVHPKMGLSQALDIKNSGLNTIEYSYALQASFDFVVARQDGRILFAVEADGPSHLDEEARKRDHLKNFICAKLGMPLIRVGRKAVEVKLQGFSSVLTWLATLVPYAEALEDAYKTGIIPDDEVVFPTDAIAFTSEGLALPFDPNWGIINRLWHHVHTGQILRFPSILHAGHSKHSAGGVVTFSLAFVREGTFLGIGGCLAGSLLPIPEHEVSEALSLVDLDRQLSQYAKGASSPLSPADVIKKMRKHDWEEGWFFSEGDGVHPEISFTHEPRET